MSTYNPNIIGWKEWFSLESLKIPAIKGKIDTGAKTSSLHAFNIKPYKIKGIEYVKFDINPLQKNNQFTKTCKSVVVDRRMVSDSGGKKEKRFVIQSSLRIGNTETTIELTLANRHSMTFKMLLGREAIKKVKMLVDPSRSYLQGRIKRSKVLAMYTN